MYLETFADLDNDLQFQNDHIESQTTTRVTFPAAWFYRAYLKLEKLSDRIDAINTVLDGSYQDGYDDGYSLGYMDGMWS